MNEIWRGSKLNSPYHLYLLSTAYVRTMLQEFGRTGGTMAITQSLYVQSEYVRKNK